MKSLMSDPQLPVRCAAGVHLPEVPALREALDAVHRQEISHSIHCHLLLHKGVCSEFIVTYIEYTRARWCKSQMFMNYKKKKKNNSKTAKTVFLKYSISTDEKKS